MRKYSRGRDYFQKNRVGIFVSDIFGLLSLLAEPQGVKVLDHTKKSSDAKTSKLRYLSTVFHTMSWYEEKLEPGSKYGFFFGFQ